MNFLLSRQYRPVPNLQPIALLPALCRLRLLLLLGLRSMAATYMLVFPGAAAHHHPDPSLHPLLSIHFIESRHLQPTCSSLKEAIKREIYIKNEAVCEDRAMHQHSLTRGQGPGLKIPLKPCHMTTCTFWNISILTSAQPDSISSSQYRWLLQGIKIATCQPPVLVAWCGLVNLACFPKRVIIMYHLYPCRSVFCHCPTLQLLYRPVLACRITQKAQPDMWLNCCAHLEHWQSAIWHLRAWHLATPTIKYMSIKVRTKIEPYCNRLSPGRHNFSTAPQLTVTKPCGKGTGRRRLPDSFSTVPRDSFSHTNSMRCTQRNTIN